MNLYPVMLNLEDRTCVIVGGGAVAARKVDHLLNAGAYVTVISPELHPTLITLARDNKITVKQVAYTSGMLADLKPTLVFAATDDTSVNQQVVDEARSIGALVNASSEQGERDFINMATIQRGDITIALSTGSASPALVTHLQRQIDTFIGDEYVTLSTWMGQARPLVQAGIKSQSERAALWRRVLESSILDTLRQGEASTAQQLFDQIIHEALDHSV
ncbi:MAG: bifunctional precorrin-2 dehydrogenase/sirohydrochlorin ferrochelatase [Chloroflexota bacterium]